MNYTNLVQAIAQQQISTISNMKTRSPDLKHKINRMMDPSDTPAIRKVWATQVSLNKQARFVVLVSSGHVKCVEHMIWTTDSSTNIPTCVRCSGDGIQIGQLVQFDLANLTAVTLSVATEVDTAILDLKAIDVSPTDFKDHEDPELTVSNKRLGFEEGVNFVVTPVMWALPPTFVAPHGADVTKDYRVPPASESTNGEWKDTIPMLRIMQHQVNFLHGHLCQSVANLLFHNSNWANKETGKVATNVCGSDLVTSHYGRLTLLDDVSELYKIARPLVEAQIVKKYEREVASFDTNTAPEAPGADAEIETVTESINQFAMFTKSLVDKIVKSNDSLEKEEKRQKHEEIKWKYQLCGSSLVQGTHGLVCKPGVLSNKFDKLLNRASVSDITDMLQVGFKRKMATLKEALDPISFFTDFKTEIINQTFAVNLENCTWQLESIENYNSATMDQRLSMIQMLAVDPDHLRFLALLDSERTHNMEELHEPNKKKRATKGKTLFIDGGQTTSFHLYNACCNYLTLLCYMYNSAKETAQYKAIYKVFHYWLDVKGIKWLD